MKRKFSIILVIALLLSVFAVPTNAQAAIAISKKKAAMELDSTLTLKVNGLAKGTAVTWTSSKTTVATVGKTTGTITAKKVGTATITGTANGKKYTCTVTVVDSNKATPKPTAKPTATPKPTESKYKEGSYKVGKDIPAGEYVLFNSGSFGAYFELNSSSSGDFADIICNDNFDYCSILTVSDGQYLKLSRCYAVPIDEATVKTNGSGMFKVGLHIKAGEYKLESTSTYSAYIEVATDSTHLMDSIVTNDNFENTSYITVSEGQYLQLSNCKIVK